MEISSSMEGEGEMDDKDELEVCHVIEVKVKWMIQMSRQSTIQYQNILTKYKLCKSNHIH